MSAHTNAPDTTQTNGQAHGQANGKTMTDGFHLVVDALKLNGVENLYGVAGIPITDLLRLAHAEGMRYIGFRHEQQAANAAAIAGFITGKPGICMTVSAPGFLNGLVGLANATVNCFPMVLISGSSDRNIVDLEQGDYEEMDQLSVARPHAKAAYRVNRPQDIGLGIARAIRAASSGRPGGVYLDLTAEALAGVVDGDTGRASLIQVVDPSPAQPASQEAIARAVEVLASAQRPLVLLGKGAAYAHADDEIRTFIESTGIPFLPMSMAKGLLPDNHAQSAAAARSFAIGQADVVLVAGARLNWLLSHGKAPLWNPDTKLIQIDISATEMDSNRAVAAPVVGDIKSVFAALNAALKPGQIKPSAQWLEDISSRKQSNVEKMAKRLAADPSPMNFSSALRAVRDAIAGNPDVYIVNEGANTLDFGRNILDMFKPRHRLDSGTWGVMGIGMGYAIGAAVETGQPVVAVEGDSAFGFSGMEIETICRYGLPVTTVIFNNSGIYRGDKPGAEPSPTGFVANAHYEKIIEGFGGRGYFCEDTRSLQAAVAESLASGKPALINAIIDPTAGTESGHIQNLNPKSALAAS